MGCQRSEVDKSVRGVEVRSMGCQRSGMIEVSGEWGVIKMSEEWR